VASFFQTLIGDEQTLFGYSDETDLRWRMMIVDILSPCTRNASLQCQARQLKRTFGHLTVRSVASVSDGEIEMKESRPSRKCVDDFGLLIFHHPDCLETLSDINSLLAGPVTNKSFASPLGDKQA
jgi:hypothetical protein